MSKTLFFILVLVFTGVNASFAQSKKANPKITAMRAMLFYQDTGKFSDDVLTTPSDLWNVSFDSVYSTFVVVEIESTDKGGMYPLLRLDLVARYIPLEGSKHAITVRKSNPFWFVPDAPDWFSKDKHKAFVGFWIDNVGCDPVSLSANIRGQKTRFRKTINFGCGE